ncbi:MAG: hypothetical protein ACLQLH_16855 [Terracidiphilus sp.]
MTPRLLATVLALGSFPLLAQTHDPASAGVVHTSDIGFSYSIPADWEVVDTKPTLPAVQAEVAKTAKNEDEKKGIGCVQVALTARHGDPSSVVVVVALPYDCYGTTMTAKDLPSFGSGAAEGIRNKFNISNAVHGSYTVGTHGMWVERASGVLKDDPGVHYTVETVCSVLKKGAVCWLAMAADKAGLQTFENGAVALDGEVSAALVPATAFEKQP